jgi:predicted dehydrogenase
MKLGICGLGLIGRQRLTAVQEFFPGVTIYAFDPFSPAETDIGSAIRVWEESELWELQLDGLIISTPHSVATELVEKALKHGIRTLVEKPMGRNLGEAEKLRTLDVDGKLSVGFNYRFMPAITVLDRAITNKELGEIISVEISLGHGGSPEDKSSWKLDPEIAGGGALLDPGIHLLDLLVNPLRGLGELKISSLGDWSGFWKTGIEEHVEMFGSIGESAFHMTSSVVQWRTTFRIFVLGTDGYIEISGRGRSDGPQILTKGSRWGWKSAPSQLASENTEVLMTRDNSLEQETKAWMEGRDLVCTSEQALQTMRVYSKLAKELTNA